MAFPTPEQLFNQLPLVDDLKKSIEGFRSQLRWLIHTTNKAPSFVVVVGPCSIHHAESALEFAKRLRLLQEQVGDTLFLVMRCYLEKPRSFLGWKGFINDPFLDGSCLIEKGLFLARKLLLQIASLGVPIAMEFVDPLTAACLADLVSWSAIGARTITSPVHRQMASWLPMPVGHKNPLDGNVEAACHSILTAQQSHHFLHLFPNGSVAPFTSRGNNDGHLVLRGSYLGANCSYSELENYQQQLKKQQLPASILVDCAHGNSQKVLPLQKALFHQMLRYRQEGASLLGCMLESFLEEGSQLATPNASPNRSVTDPCLDWTTTKELLLTAADLCCCSSLSF